jgi:hypothetical protein
MSELDLARANISQSMSVTESRKLTLLEAEPFQLVDVTSDDPVRQ